MIDAVTTANFPLSTKVAACYVDGRFANVAGVRARLPKAHILTISTQGAVADCVDCESGDLTIPETIAWVDRRVAAGAGLIVVYANLSTWDGGLMSGLAHYGNRIKRWLAHPKTAPTIPAGFDAKQYIWRGDIDISVISKTFLTPWSPPKKPDVPKGKARALVTVDLATQKVTAVRGTPGVGVHFAGSEHWMPVQVALNIGKGGGKWRK